MENRIQNAAETFETEKAVLEALKREIGDGGRSICPERVVALSGQMEALIAKEKLLSQMF